MSAPPEIEPEVGELLEESREALSRPPDRREATVELLVAVLFALVAAVVAVSGPSHRPLDLALVLALVAALALCSRVEFAVGAGFTVPTELVLVPMLFLAPLNAVPALVGAAFLIGRAPDFASGRARPQRAASTLSDAWHSAGPVLVLSVAGAATASEAGAVVLVAALAAQLALDVAVSLVRATGGLGVRPPLVLRELRWTAIVDAALASLGVLIALEAEREPWTWLLAMPLVALLAVFARERQGRIEHALELSSAYRGTALLLGDVVEADDEYTAQHSRGVVSLAVEVGERLGLTARQLQELEFAALLHDVGKLRIPKEIIRKPGALTDPEFDLVKTHTIEGERLLNRVGGRLADVGGIVRSCHERWDGRGYPDGLKGENIPLAARIVFACDAFNAMTTDRSYRKAMPQAAAVAELRANRGTQFDPRVVDELLEVLGAPAERDAAPAEAHHPART